MKTVMSAGPVGRRQPPIARERRGAMLVFIAISMVTLLGFLAMTLDVGAGNRQRRIAQTAADAGAIGGGTEIFRTQYDSVVASATNEAIRNGFIAGEITVNYPPATGPYAGNNQYVEVLINRTIPTIFGSIFSVASMNVAARGVAGVGSYSLNCVYSLDPSGPGAIEVNNGGVLETNCGVSINSTDGNALDVNSAGILDATGSSIAITGGWTGNKTPTPAPATGTAASPDPLDYLQQPTVGACDFTGLVTVSGTQTLNPGVYCGGIKITAGSNTANLNPGTYILKGGLEVGTSGRIFGDEVTFFNTFDGTYPFKPFNFSTGCKATLSAPTSGPLSGVLMYQDSLAPANAINTFACSSDSGPELTGILYFPTQTILFSGSNSDTEIVGGVVANKVEIGMGAKVQITNVTTPNTALKRLSLVE